MDAILPLITILGEAAKTISSSAVLGKIIDTLTQVVPIVLRGVDELGPAIAKVKQAIADVKSNKAITPEQIADLESFSAQCDAIFEEAAKPQPGDPDYVPAT